MGILVLLSVMAGLFDIPVVSDPLVTNSGVVDYAGTMRGDLVFKYQEDSAGTKLMLPLSLRLMPSTKNRFKLLIPFVWWTPKAQPRRQGLGDMEVGWARQIFRFGPNFWLLGADLSLPTTTDTLKPEHHWISIKPYGAYTLVLGSVSGFAEFGVRVPSYDVEVGEYLGSPVEYDYGLALRFKPFRLIEIGLEFRSESAQVIPELSLYLAKDLEVCGGLVIPIERGEQTILAGARLRL
jgi:hypothetical protein